MGDSNTCKFRLPESNEITTLKIATLSVACCLGSLANIFIIVLALRCNTRKNLRHLISTMAVFDAVFLMTHLLINIPILSGGKLSILNEGKLSIFVCQGLVYVHDASPNVSLVILLAISIERFRATFAKRSKPQSIKKQFFILGICICSPLIYYASNFILYKATVKKGYCVYSIVGLKYTAIHVLIPILLRLILFMFIFVFSVLTIRRLSKSTEILSYLSEVRKCIRVRRIRAAVTMVLASLILYMLCWLPVFLLSIVYWFQTLILKDKSLIDYSRCIDWKSIIFVVIFFLPVLNSCLSPAVYIKFLSDYRKAARKAFCRK